MNRANTSPRETGQGHRASLRSRFEKAGLAAFSPHEILELILTLAIPRKDVKAPAKALLKRFGSLKGVLDADPKEISETEGIGNVTPVALKIIKEVASLYLQQTAQDAHSFVDARLLSDFWRMRIGSLRNEVFEVGYLDSGYRLLSDGIETLEEGTIDRATVYPRKLVESALRRGAAAIVLAHNHPNGRAEPSDQDKSLTKAVVLATATVGITVHDHLILTADSVFSFREKGLV